MTAYTGRVARSPRLLALLGAASLLACGTTNDLSDAGVRDDAAADTAPALTDAPSDAMDAAPPLACLDPDCVAGVYTVERHVGADVCGDVASTPVDGEPVFYINPHSFQGRRVRLSLDWCESVASCVFRDNVSPFDWVWFPDNDPNARVRETTTEQEEYDEVAQICAAIVSDFRLTAPSEGIVRVETTVYRLALGEASSIDACLDLQRDTLLETVRSTGACVRTETVEGRFTAELP
ncbi:MAG: hypothetical protein AAF938_26270 [Myxococcota bacterium]